MLKVLLNPGPCIHYILCPTDPAFTISGLPQALHSLYLVSHSTQNMEMQLF
ncbi:unnamed protein product [Staurois parvus]|uniref:Uncharacterized protein n=1 Tax=Staurois parvus TaxID=386267 RepID=A0ABN9CSA1_9NEOB|nr:unnamed protein product [Staurois parvus]